MVIEFAELIAGKSGKAMADILYDSIGPDFKKETEIIEGDTIKTVTEERISLKCAQKLFTVYGDNTLINNIIIIIFDNNKGMKKIIKKLKIKGI